MSYGCLNVSICSSLSLILTEVNKLEKAKSQKIKFLTVFKVLEEYCIELFPKQKFTMLNCPKMV